MPTVKIEIETGQIKIFLACAAALQKAAVRGSTDQHSDHYVRHVFLLFSHFFHVFLLRCILFLQNECSNKIKKNLVKVDQSAIESKERQTMQQRSVACSEELEAVSECPGTTRLEF